MISKETLALINTFKNPLLEVLTDIKDEVKFYFDTGIIKYIESIREKFNKTKTFLYRLENVDFYDVYYPISLANKSSKNYVVDDIDDMFKKTNYISIIGSAGSGKSMLMKHIFLKTIMQIVKIPIVIELRNLNDYEGGFFDYLNTLLSNKKLVPNKKILDRILSNGEFLFLFDGYDEIYSNTKTKLTSELLDFIDNYDKNFYLITSRPGANVESLPRFDSYYVNDLNIEQVKEFTILQLKNCGDNMLANKIISAIDKPENKDYKSYLSNPLLLSMFIMTFNSYPEIPRLKSKFYWNVFDTLCTKHDSFTKQGGYQHERKSGLQNEDFENVLKWFSYISLFKGKYSFDEEYFTNNLKIIKNKLQLKCSINHLKEDLTTAISIILIDGLEYKFPHKSLQEYFAALLIKEQKEEIKKEIYVQKLGKLFENSHGGYENFWSICSEVDSVAFNKFFILRYLKETIKNTELFTSKQIDYKSLIQAAGHSFYLYMKDGKTQSGLFTGNPISVSILEFVGIDITVSVKKEISNKYHYVTHLLIWDEIKEVEKMNLAFTPKKLEIIPYDPFDSEVEPFQEKHELFYSFNDCNVEFQENIISKILSQDDIYQSSRIIKTIKQKVRNLEKEIKTLEQNRNELLDL